MNRSGSLRVSPDVYIVGGADLSHPYDCSVYVVDGGQEMVLIDTGAATVLSVKMFGVFR